jgi:uncharacterized membrane protein
MHPHPSPWPGRILAFLANLLVLKIIATVFINYKDYFPLNFSSEFPHGREGDFLGVYAWSFYVHILSGPVSLILGMILVHDRLRSRYPAWHRALGRVQVACVLLLVTPSGLWMATRAAAGPIAGVGLASLAVATAVCVSLGARAAARRRFAVHRRWMWRCYLLLCSAVVLRVLGGMATVAGVTALWFDPLATWLCWVGPLLAFELREWTRRNRFRFNRNESVAIP